MESDFIKSGKFELFNGTDEEYHGDKTRISKSGMSEIKQSPSHYKEGIEDDEENTSDALIFGSAYHCYILEPKKFEDEYYIFKDNSVCEAIIAKSASDGKEVKNVRATKEYKEWKISEMRIIGNKKLITEDVFSRIQAMKDKLFRHTYIRSLLSNGRAEVAYNGELQTIAGEIRVKFKPDYIKDNKHLVIDLKTTRQASKKGFPKEAADHDYHIQAAFYADMMNLVEGKNTDWTFIFIAQEKVKPFAFNIFEASTQFMGQGRYEYEMLLQLYQFCIDNNTWPGYQVWCENKYGILELRLPAYAIDSLDYFDHNYSLKNVENGKQLAISN